MGNVAGHRCEIQRVASDATIADHLSGYSLKATDLQPIDIDNDDRETIVAFAALVACVLAALYSLGRIGFDNPVSPIIETLGLSLFVTAFPLVAMRLLTRGEPGLSTIWWKSQPCMGLFAVALVALAGMLAVRGLNTVAVFAVAGFASALSVVVRWIARGRIAANLLRLGCAGAFGVWVAGVVWSSRHKLPLFWETLVFNGNVHHDPFYFVSMGNMIETYGVPSTGLDGIPYTPYHYGSAWLFAQFAALVKMDLLSFYNLGPPVIAVPFLFGSVGLLAVEWRKRQASERKPGTALRHDRWAWIVFLVATVGVVPSIGLDALGVWIRHVLISESYVTGLPCFILALSTIGIFWDQWRKGDRTQSDWMFLFGFLPVVIVALGFLKISTMLLFFAVIILVLLLTAEWRSMQLVVGALMLAAIAGIVYRAVSVPGQNQGIVPFAYMRSSVLGGWWPYFLVAHFFWSWLYIAARLWEERVRDLGDLFDGIRSLRLLDVAVVAVIALGGLLPGELIDIHGGSAFYFSDIQRWIAVPLVMASASRWTSSFRRSTTVANHTSLFHRIRIAHVWGFLLLSPLIASFVMNAVLFPANAVAVNLSLRRALYRRAGVVAGASASIPADKRVIDVGLRRSPAYSLLTKLKQLGSLPVEDRRRSLVFIPQSYATFWHIFPEAERCTFVPMVAPAVTRMAMLDGMPPYDCPVSDQYNLPEYRSRSEPQSASILPLSLCRQAARMGFATVFVIEPAGSNDVNLRVLSCGNMRGLHS